MTPNLPQTACVVMLAFSMVSDLAMRRIPNWITVPAVAGALVYHCSLFGVFSGLLYTTSGGVVGCGLLLPLYAAGGMGGGDMKLLGALGAWGGPGTALNIFIYSAVISALWAAAILAQRKSLSVALSNIRKALYQLAATGRWPGIALTGARLPYAVALGAGYIGYRINGALV